MQCQEINPGCSIGPGFFMPKQLLLLVIVLAGITVPAHAQTYAYTERCDEAYHHIMDLELTKARQILLIESRENASNLMPILFSNYADFVEIFTREQEELYDQLYDNKKARINQIDQKGDAQSAYHRFIKAEILLQWAFLETKFKDYLAALWDFRKAYQLLTENKELHQDFLPNLKSLGLLHILIGTVPKKYRWAVNLAGLEGNIEQGLRELQRVIDAGQKKEFPYYRETAIYYSTILLHIIQNEEKAWQITMEANLPDTSELITGFAAGNTALFTGHNEKALQWLGDSRHEATQKGFPYLHFLYGLAKIQKLAPHADQPFHTYLSHYKGQDHIKEAYQKIGWYYLIRGDTMSYRKFLSKAGKFGRTVLDGDKQAQQEVERSQRPHPVLLKARLLSDGGYYQRADSLLNTYEKDDFTREKSRIELIYRKGRILHDWGKPDQAISYYQKTIKLGKDAPYYYAANAALNLGYIERSKGNEQEALRYFRLSMDTENHPYKNSIDQKAKMAIEKMKG